MIGKIGAAVLLTVLTGFAAAPDISAPDTTEHNLLLEGGDAAILATRHRFYITYTDEVTGGCLPKPSRLRDKLELSMRRNRLEILPEKSGGVEDSLHLNALGFRAGPGYCAVSLTLTLKSWIPVKVPYSQGNPSGEMTMIPWSFIVGQYLLTGRKRDMQRRLEKVAQELGDSLYLQISRSRDKIFRDFPVIESNFKASLRR
jgi:hypothetical protein